MKELKGALHRIMATLQNTQGWIIPETDDYEQVKQALTLIDEILAAVPDEITTQHRTACLAKGEGKIPAISMFKATRLLQTIAEKQE